MYLSLFFKRHRDEYYRRLAAVRTQGDWEGWIRYFLEAVATISVEATASAREIFSLTSRDRAKVLAGHSSTLTAARLFELLPMHPVVSTAKVMHLLATTRPTANKAIHALLDVGILKETTGKKRDREFAYSAYLNLLKTGTELSAKRVLGVKSHEL